MSASDANSAGLKTSYESTADARLEDDLVGAGHGRRRRRPRRPPPAHGARARWRRRRGRPDRDRPRDRADAAAHRVLGPALDRLIDAHQRLHGARRDVAVLTTVLTLLAVYLFVALLLAIREGTGRMRRRLASLGART